MINSASLLRLLIREQKVEAIIVAYFSSGPVHAKVSAGEFELFDPLDSSEVVLKSDFNGLRLGHELDHGNHHRPVFQCILRK
jgi:hypothetical protein